MTLLDLAHAAKPDARRDRGQLHPCPQPDGHSCEAVSYTHLDVYKRQRISSGVYLVLVSDDGKKERAATKIFFISK